MFDELDQLDQPRGVVAAANRYAASKVSVVDMVKLVREMPTREWQNQTMTETRAKYVEHFNAFIAGAQWTNRLLQHGRAL